jgi:DNA-binding response OmpR family regulator
MPVTVLIVEDADSCLDMLAVALDTMSDVRVETAGSGQQAWRTIQEQTVSAIITDLHLPVMDGFELIEKIRAGERTAKLPVIVVSGDSDPGTPDRVRRLGADAFFEKPYSPAQVRATLERLLHERSLEPSP